jgi:hypothetical protein
MMAMRPGQFDAIAATLPLGRDPHSVRARLISMERLLERSFTIPGTKYPVGLDAVVGLVPVIGDIIGAAMGSWLIWEARNLGMSKFQLIRMGGNVAVDTVLGMVPFAGDAFDLLFRSNTRNLRIILKWMDKHHPETQVIEGEVVKRG